MHNTLAGAERGRRNREPAGRAVLAVGSGL